MRASLTLVVLALPCLIAACTSSFAKPTPEIITVVVTATPAPATLVRAIAPTSTPKPAPMAVPTATSLPTVAPVTDFSSFAWNTNDMDVATNGNLLIAIGAMQDRSALQLEQVAIDAVPGSVFKAPWNYYGKVVKIAGTVGIVQEYPPNNAASQAVGGHLSEIVMATRDMTFVDFLLLGSSGSISVGDAVTVYGLPIGQEDVTNRLGGQTTQLVLVGKSAH